MGRQIYCSYNQKALMMLGRSFKLTIYHNTLRIIFPSRSHELKLKVKQGQLKVPIIK